MKPHLELTPALSMSAAKPAILFCLGLALSACSGSGGGGGGAGSGGNPFLTNEYARTPGLSQIRAAETYNLTRGGREGGEGQSVGVIDDGIDGSHEDIQRALSRGGSFDMLPGQAGDRSHGTAVAGIVAAERNDRGTMGVAFNAALVDYDAGTNDNRISGLSAIDAMRQAADAGTPQAGRADVLNMSWGSTGTTTFYTDTMRYAADRGVVMVVSTGNDSLAEPDSPASVVTDPQIAGMGIAVAAGTRRGLASYSNACGSAAQYCLVAPGTTRTSAAGTRLGIVSFSGTSAAAPHVAGAFAVLAAAFPNLSERQIVERMLSTADPIPGCPESECGQGFLNMERALNALGSVTVAGASRNPNAAPAGAVGRGGAVSTQAIRAAMQGVVVLDEGGAAFYGDLSPSVSAGEASDLGELMRIDNSWMSGPADWTSR